jgi:hypothetical protein
MEFEEFFKKKKIDLPVLEKTEPELFSEFKTHYGQMGEKSFDHTKKYWFNKLRHQFPLSPEIKTEKVHIANPIAEQTVTESLIETVLPPPSAKVGFTPRFKAGAATKPAETTEDKKEETPPVTDQQSPETPTPTPSPKVGFTPRFKAGVTTKPAEVKEDTKEENPSVADQQASETPAPAPSPKVGFTPRFKAGVTKPAEAQADKKEEALPASDSQASETTAPAPSPKVGFTPRFKAGVTKSAGTQEDKKEEALPSAEESSKETPSEENTESKPAAYKPRFKMKPKTDEE